jgi:hypothetical protein
MADESPTLLDVWRLLQDMSRTLDRHTEMHESHSRKLDEHSRMHEAHTRRFDEHSRMHEEHTRRFDEHSRMHEEHTRRFDEHSRSFQEIWSLLGRMNRRMDGFDERFDAFERRLIVSNDRVGAQMAALDARVMTAIGALRESIENRDFRLDEHGRRLSKLEASQP